MPIVIAFPRPLRFGARFWSVMNGKHKYHSFRRITRKQFIEEHYGLLSDCRDTYFYRSAHWCFYEVIGSAPKDLGIVIKEEYNHP